MKKVCMIIHHTNIADEIHKVFNNLELQDSSPIKLEYLLLR